MKQRAMISQPMVGRSDEEIAATRGRAVAVLESKGYEVVNTLFTEDWHSERGMGGVTAPGLFYLAKSLDAMSRCHAAYFCRGWDRARGCVIEEAAARAYGIDVIYEE